jgi:hypothetical protein
MSGTPMTAASTINTCVSSVRSISAALSIQPAEMISSSERRSW